MLPTSPNELRAYTPYEFKEEARKQAEQIEGADMSKFDNPPVYYVSVPTVRDRAKFHRLLAAEGAIQPQPFVVRNALREGIKAHVQPDQQEELMAIVEEVMKDNPSEEALIKYDDLERQIAAVHPPLCRMIADNAYYRAMVPVIACQLFLKKVENLDIKLEFMSGKLSEESLNQIPLKHVNEIGWFALASMALPKDQEKNSESQSH
jgi:hypothetical protein